MAAKKRARRRNQTTSRTRYVLVRGARTNPNVMASAPSKNRLNKLKKFLQSHFPAARVRVEKVNL